MGDIDMVVNIDMDTDIDVDVDVDVDMDILSMSSMLILLSFFCLMPICFSRSNNVLYSLHIL
jgi:hypothetical protein